MKESQINHAWEKCRESGRRPLRVEMLSVGVGESLNAIKISSRITAVVGVNGSGKTGLLRGVSEILNGGRHSHFRERPLKISGQFRGGKLDVVAGSNLPDGLNVLFCDISKETHELISILKGFGDLEDLMSQAGPRLLKGEELSAFRYACFKQYDEVKVFELERPAELTISEDAVEDGRDVVPHFVVKIGNIVYDSLSMGFGELCICYLVWKMWGLERSSILLLDEPDSHLSPPSRRALLDLLAFYADQKDFWVFFSSHAVDSLHRLSESEISLIYSENADVPPRLALASDKRAVIRTLGLSTGRRLIILVEDVDAEEALVQILRKYGSEICDCIEVKSSVLGAEQLIGLQRQIPKDIAAFKILVVLDGDKRDAFKSSDDVLFLPGDEDPILQAMNLVLADCQDFCKRMGIEQAAAEKAVNGARHRNYHDFCGVVAGNLTMQGVSAEFVRRHALSMWVCTDVVAKQAPQLIKSLSDVVLKIPIDR
ncbi:MAG: hypothetical protein ACOY3E_06320 [Pseudomonadota bacterium]